MTNLEDWAAVQRVYKATKSKRATARLLGMSKNTVKSLLRLKEPPRYHRKTMPNVIDDYKEQIIIWKMDPYNYNGTRIYKELRDIGYKGSLASVYRYLRIVDEDINGHISKKATVRHESPPGDQAQFDWTEYQVLVGGRYRTVYCFSLILAASRKKAVCFSLRENAEAIYEAIQELFDDIGGSTLELLIDNPKSLVIENNPKSEDEIRYNPSALLIARHLGLELNACPYFWPRKKGKIERCFPYIEEQFIKGRSFDNMEDLNRQGKKFVEEWNNKKHSTTGRVPNIHFMQDEYHLLNPLPEEHYYTKGTTERKVSPDSYVSIGSNKYSVPVQYVGKKVTFRINYGFRIIIYSPKGDIILKTEAFDGKHMVLTDDEHYEPIKNRVATSIPQIRRDFTARFENGARYLYEADKIFEQPTHHARRILELCELYDDKMIDSFIEKAINENRMSIKEFKKIIREYNSERRAQTTADTNTESNEELTRDCSYYENIGKEAINNG